MKEKRIKKAELNQDFKDEYGDTLWAVCWFLTCVHSQRGYLCLRRFVARAAGSKALHGIDTFCRIWVTEVMELMLELGSLPGSAYIRL